MRPFENSLRLTWTTNQKLGRDRSFRFFITFNFFSIAVHIMTAQFSLDLKIQPKFLWSDDLLTTKSLCFQPIFFDNIFSWQFCSFLDWHSINSISNWFAEQIFLISYENEALEKKTFKNTKSTKVLRVPKTWSTNNFKRF